MRWDQISGRWDEIAARARQQWGKLNFADTDEIGGERCSLAGRIQARYAVGREEAENQIDVWIRSL